MYFGMNEKGKLGRFYIVDKIETLCLTYNNKLISNSNDRITNEYKKGSCILCWIIRHPHIRPKRKEKKEASSPQHD